MLASDPEMEVVGETGRFCDAAVEGLRSCAGSGCFLIEASWIREVMLAADDMVDMFTAETKGRPISEVNVLTYGSSSGILLLAAQTSYAETLIGVGQP